jgi:hypothetical protein
MNEKDGNLRLLRGTFVAGSSRHALLFKISPAFADAAGMEIRTFLKEENPRFREPLCG